MEAERKSERYHIRTAHPAIAGFEGRGKDHQPRNTGDLWKQDKARKWDSPLRPADGRKPCYSLIWAR